MSNGSAITIMSSIFVGMVVFGILLLFSNGWRPNIGTLGKGTKGVMTRVWGWLIKRQAIPKTDKKPGSFKKAIGLAVTLWVVIGAAYLMNPDGLTPFWREWWFLPLATAGVLTFPFWLKHAGNWGWAGIIVIAGILVMQAGKMSDGYVRQVVTAKRLEAAQAILDPKRLTYEMRWEIPAGTIKPACVQGRNERALAKIEIFDFDPLTRKTGTVLKVRVLNTMGPDLIFNGGLEAERFQGTWTQEERQGGIRVGKWWLTPQFDSFTNTWRFVGAMMICNTTEATLTIVRRQ